MSITLLKILSGSILIEIRFEIIFSLFHSKMIFVRNVLCVIQIQRMTRPSQTRKVELLFIGGH